MNSKLYMLSDRICYMIMFALIGLFSKYYGESVWKLLTNTFDDFMLVGFGAYVVAIFTASVACGILAIVDLIVPSKKMLPIKIQKDKMVSMEQYQHGLPLVLFNYVIVTALFSLPFMYLFHPSSPRNHKGTERLYLALPSWTEIIISVISCVLLEEISFYYIHRLFHHPKLYSLIHKKHHEFTAPIGIAAFYMTPLDFALSNLIPALSGPTLLNVHPVSFYAYMFATVISTVITHSGYEFKYFPWAMRHDFHHQKHNSTFGLIGLMDYIHNTDVPFQDKLIKTNHVRAYKTSK